MLDDLAEALLTDGFGILERSGDGTRLEEAVQSALAAPEALKRAEAEAPEVTKERREMPWDENPEGTMVETGEDWIDLPDETPEAAASSLASGDVDPLAPFARDDEFLVAMLEESIAFCGGRETDVRRTLEQTAKRLGFTYEALMKGAADGTAVGRVVAQVKREHPVFATRN